MARSEGSVIFIQVDEKNCHIVFFNRVGCLRATRLTRYKLEAFRASYVKSHNQQLLAVLHPGQWGQTQTW